jgi:hypothetical protein
MTELVKPSNGRMTALMPCYNQPAVPPSIPFDIQICNVQIQITGSVDPNRTYVYTGPYDSRRLNISSYVDDAPGADDNASAVAIALELVRILAPVVAKTLPAASIIIAAVGEKSRIYTAAIFLLRHVGLFCVGGPALTKCSEKCLSQRPRKFQRRHLLEVGQTLLLTRSISKLFEYLAQERIS